METCKIDMHQENYLFTNVLNDMTWALTCLLFNNWISDKSLKDPTSRHKELTGCFYDLTSQNN